MLELQLRSDLRSVPQAPEVLRDGVRIPRSYRSALTAAAEAGDTQLGAYAIGSASVLPAWRSSPSESVRLLTEAEVHGFQINDASPSTRAWVYSLEAEAHTRADNESRAFAALENADRILTSSTNANDTRAPRIAFFDQIRLLGERGITAIRFDRTVDG